MTHTLAKVRFETSGALLALCRMSDPAAALIDPSAPPASAFAALLSAGRVDDAVRFLAAGLPVREGVWWACLCAHETLPGQPAPTEGTALSAAEAWVRRPSEALRRAAERAAVADGPGTPAGWAAMGAFWSGGSLAPAKVKSSAPAPPGLSSRAVVAAVLSAAVRPDPRRREANLREFLEWGTDIADGGRGRPAKRPPSIPEG